MTNHGCGFASWGEAIRHWRTMAAILLIGALAACLPIPPIGRVAEATPTPIPILTPTPGGAEFYRGVYATCIDAMAASGVGETAALQLCGTFTQARRQAEWHATEWPGEP